jgi:hypothetical protein
LVGGKCLMLKYLLSFIVIFNVLNSSVFPNKTLAEWAYIFVVWDGFTYVVSDEIVTEVDNVVGNVTIYSSIEGTYTGNFSNAYKEGTKYYSIKGIDTNEAIAIQENDGKYKRANRKGEYAGAIKDKENNLNESNKNSDLGGNNPLDSNYSILVLLFLLIIILGIPFAKKKMK